MPMEILNRGNYRLMKTEQLGHKLLVLRADLYDWFITARGQYLSLSQEEPVSAQLIVESDFVLLLPHQEKGWRDDIQYLELRQPDGHYSSYRLPFGLPRDFRQQKLIEPLSQRLSSEQIRQYV